MSETTEERKPVTKCTNGKRHDWNWGLGPEENGDTCRVCKVTNVEAGHRAGSEAYIKARKAKFAERIARQEAKAAAEAENAKERAKHEREAAKAEKVAQDPPVKVKRAPKAKQAA